MGLIIANTVFSSILDMGARIEMAMFHPCENSLGSHVVGLFLKGILPELQRTGIGPILVGAFFEEAHKRGCKRVFHTTDCYENNDVNRFYKKLGFFIDRQFKTPERCYMNECLINL